MIVHIEVTAGDIAAGERDRTGVAVLPGLLVNVCELLIRLGSERRPAAGGRGG